MMFTASLLLGSWFPAAPDYGTDCQEMVTDWPEQDRI